MKLLRLSLLLSTLQLSLAVNVFLNPTPSSSFSSTLSPEDASLALSHHLGLELFEVLQESGPVYVNSPVNFVAVGQNNALVVVMDQFDAKGKISLSRFLLCLPTWI